MKPRIKNFFFFFLGAFGMMLLMYLFNNYKIEKKNEQNNQEISYQKSENQNQDNSYSYEKHSKKSEDFEKKKEENFDENSIENLTNETVVINYVKANHKLPEYYITKSEAKRNGWNPGESLCDAVPGKAIGGDHFSNREGNFPKGEQYFEADVNYNCGHRNADRIIFTKNGDVWLTHDHYKTFQKK